MRWRHCGRAIALGVSAFALASAARAADRPADDVGVKSIAAFIMAYAGEAALPNIEIKQDGSSYLVAIDIATVAAALKPTGFAYDPAKIRFRVSHQDDGQWRVELANLPALTGHMKGAKGEQIDVHFEHENLTQVWTLDPKLNWIASGHSQWTKAALTERATGLQEFLETRDFSLDLHTTSAAQGLTTVAVEPIGQMNLLLDIGAKGADAKTGPATKSIHISANATRGEARVSLSNFQPGPLLEGWRFLAAHPTRADAARDAAALKGILTALVADPMTLDEAFKIEKIDVQTDGGPIAIENAAIGVGAFNVAAGAGFSESLSATSLKLPDGLVPPAYAALTPTAFDFGFKASGFDLAAAVQEWVADAKLDGTGPILSPEDSKKVSMKLWALRPVVVEILPSHFTAPSLDLTMEGKFVIDKGQPTGTLTLKAKKFDEAADALQAAAPDKASQFTPMFAMAKGLGKAQPDGSLVWVYSLGADKVMKVNGLPLGKSPY